MRTFLIKRKLSLLIFFKKSYTVKVNNNTYTVAISNPLDILIKEMGFETGITKQVSTYAGIDSEISVVVGQEGKKTTI
jgi:hypothetical protein